MILNLTTNIPKPYQPTKRVRNLVANHALWILLCLFTGCATRVPLPEAYQALDAGQHAMAYRLAKQVYHAPNSSIGSADRHLAAYAAGLAAYRLKQYTTAQRYLESATGSSNRLLSGDAYATIGLIHHRLGRLHRASNAFIAASKRLSGENRAKSYYFAAVVENKLGSTAKAMTYLTLSKSLTRDHTLKQRINLEQNQTGFTVQAGAFRSQSRAHDQVKRVNQRAGTRGIGRARLVQADRGPLTLWLVQIGHFSTFATAERARKLLHLPDTRVVPRF